MRLIRYLIERYFLLFFLLACSSYVFAGDTTVTHVSEGKINGKTSIVVTLEGKVSSTLDLPVTKDKVAISPSWTISNDRTFQYMSIAEHGLGSYEVSLSSVSRGQLEPIQLITIHESSPALRVLGSGPFLNASGDRAIPIESVNATGVTMSIYKVENMPELFSEFFYTRKLYAWSAQRLRKNFSHQTDLNFKLPVTAANESKVSNLTMPKELANGWYIISLKPSNSFDDASIFHVLLSDIGLQAKIFDKSVSLQAIHLQENRPVASGQVQVVGKSGVKATADLKDGFAQFEYLEREASDVVVVTSGQSVAVLPFKEVSLDLSDFAVGGESERALNAFTFSNRDLFKPGESVTANIVLREANGSLPKAQSVFVEVIKPDGKVSYSQDVNQVVPGFFAFEYRVPQAAKLGKWSFVVKGNRTAKGSYGEFSFNVDEFVPERMDLTLDFPAVVSIGDAIEGTANGRYLFGQKADGNRLVISSSVNSIEYFSGQFNDYFVGKRHYIPYYTFPQTIDLKLDDQGEAEINIPAMDVSVFDGPARLTTSNHLFESGGATTTRINRLILDNGKSIVGLRPHSSSFSYFEDAKFDVLLLDSTGERALTGDVTVKVERNRGGYYWVYNQSSGWDLRRDDKWRVVESQRLNVNATSNAFNIPVEWGDYRITLTSPDGQETVYPFYVGWREGDDAIPVKPDQLAMKLDKESYKAGEDVNVEVHSPIGGTVTLELIADKTYLHKTVEVSGNTTVTFQLPKTLQRHDLYLVANLVNGEQSYAQRQLAVAPIKLYRDDRKLDVKLNLPTKFEPFTTQQVSVSAKGRTDLEDAYVVLTIADKGILNLSRYQVPGIFDWFYAQKRLSADIVDLYSKQFESRPSSFLRHRYGGDSDATSNRPLEDLVESKTFNQVFAPVRLDENGEATIDVEVPDYNGEVQVVATVFDGKKFGQKIEDATVSAPIVAELSVPRFFSMEDQSSVYIEASNQTDKTLHVGLSLTASQGVELLGEAMKSVDIAPNKKVGFSVPVRVGKVIGQSSLKLEVTSDVYDVVRDWSVPVRAVTPYVTKKTTRVVEDGDTLTIDKKQWQGLLDMEKGLSTIAFSNAPSIEPFSFVDGLFRYPYGCVEQTTSTAYPWLLPHSSLDSIKERARNGRTDLGILQQAVARLENYQHSSGGFGLWGGDSRVDAWLTAYVVNFLFEVQKRDPALVNQDMLDNAVAYLKETINGNISVKLSDKAYGAYVLTLNGQLNYSDARRGLKQQDHRSTLTMTYLAATFAMLGDSYESKYYLNKALENLDSDTLNYLSGYNSRISSEAHVVNVVSELQRFGPTDSKFDTLKIRAAEKVFTGLNSREYFSTQEKYALMLAGFNLQQANQQPLNVIHNGQPAEVVDPLLLSKGDTFANQSGKTLYVTETVEGYADPTQLKSSLTFNSIEKSFFNLAGKPIGKAGEVLDVDVGDLMIVKLKFNLKERVYNGLVVDYLPSGLVLENPAFTASAIQLKAAGFTSSKSLMAEYRNDRFVTAARFSPDTDYVYYYVVRAETVGEVKVPHLFIEDMYSPERFVFEPSKIGQLNIER